MRRLELSQLTLALDARFGQRVALSEQRCFVRCDFQLALLTSLIVGGLHAFELALMLALARVHLLAETAQLLRKERAGPVQILLQRLARDALFGQHRERDAQTRG